MDRCICYDIYLNEEKRVEDDMVIVEFKRRYGVYRAGEIAGFEQEKLKKIPRDCYKLYEKAKPTKSAVKKEEKNKG